MRECETKEKSEQAGRQAEKRRKRLHTWLRALIQLVYFLFLPAVFAEAFAGVKYLFTQIGLGSKVEPTSFVLTLILLCLYTVVFGRFFCGFACAFGALGDAVRALYVLAAGKLGRKPVQLNARLAKGLSAVKYLILAGIVLLCFGGGYAGLHGTSPWEVFSMLRAGNFRLGGYGVGIVLLGLILVGMAVQERFFCRFLCPMGAVFSLLPVLPAFALHRDRENCLPRCSACTRRCPSGVELPAKGSLEVKGDCFQCQKCIDRCPKDNIRCGVSSLRGNEVWFTLVRAALLFVLILWISLA